MKYQFIWQGIQMMVTHHLETIHMELSIEICIVLFDQKEMYMSNKEHEF